MTQATCFKCGEIKHGAFTPCPHCDQQPVTDDELVISLIMTDHYYDLTTLKQMGASIAENGAPPNLDEKTRQMFLEQLDDLRKTSFGGALGNLGNILKKIQEPEKKKRKWWPF